MNKIALFIVYSIFPICIYGQTGHDKQVSSLIIALDKRAPSVHRSWHSYTVDRALIKLLETSKIEPDYVSGILYGVRKESPTPKDFSTLVVNPVKNETDYQKILNSLISSIPQKGDTYFSITSFAKPFSFISLKGLQETNRTFMAIITDMLYNGNDDYYNEATYAKNDFTDKGKEIFKETIKKVQTNYFCQFLGEVSIPGGYIQLYEFIPLQQYFSLETVLDYPHTVVAKRKKNGYTIDLPLLSTKNKNYEIKRLKISVSKCYDIEANNTEIDQRLILNIDKQCIRNDHGINIMAWVRLCDDVYDNTILHPFGSDLQGANGLIKKINIEKERNAKILGTFPLPNWLFIITFWTSNQYTAAAGWGWILIISFIILIIIIIAKNNIYKVDPGKIKI